MCPSFKDNQTALRKNKFQKEYLPQLSGKKGSFGGQM